MVLASPQLGRSNNHPPLSRYPICSNSSTPTDPAFLASQYVPSNGHASSIFFSNRNSLKANCSNNTSRDGATMQTNTTPYMKSPAENMDNCWTNLFNSNSNHLSNSTPVLNTTENGSRQHLQQQCGQLANATKMSSPPRSIKGMVHQLVSPSFSSSDFSDAHASLLGSYANAKINNPLVQTNSNPDSSAAISAQQQQQNQQNQQQMTNSKLYKTELCRSWVDTGRCNYGERCQYAHGETEKRPIPRHPKYKTEACQSYHKTGYCPYGPRCHFIHNEEPSVLAGLVANEASNSSSTASGGTTPTNGSNSNLLLHRQLTSLSNVSSASSPTTPQHMPLNTRMPPPPAQISAAYFQQQHQPLSSTHSWCVGGDIQMQQQQNNASNYLAARASNPLVDWSMYCPQNGIQQFYAGLQQHQQQPASAMRLPVSSTFSLPVHQQPLNLNFCCTTNTVQLPTSNTTESNATQRIISSSDGGDSSPTSSLPSSADSGTESPSLGSGSFSPALVLEAINTSSPQDSSVFCRLSPTSFRTHSLMMLNEDSANRRNSEGGSTVLAESLANASPNSSIGSPLLSGPYKIDGSSAQDQEALTKLAKNLACSMSLGANDPFETAESVAENLRRASGSSLGSVGNTQMSSTSSSANMTNNSSAASSDAEVWSGPKQALSRLPVFERLSNGPF